MSHAVSDLARAADAIDLALRHLARAERRGDPPAASVACFAMVQLDRINQRLMDACDEVSGADFPP
ncbi:MAG: hypothetical protein EXS16_20520 [Gemmataceae bacterium]|nr:hypothetical protein [Gemmataceae bacterium]